MSVIQYRKHNPACCTSKDTRVCKPANANCPIWIRGTGPDGGYVRGSVKTVLRTGYILREWDVAKNLIQSWEKSGSLPASTVTTIETWREAFIADVTTRNLSPETIRKYKHLFAQLEDFAKSKGLQFVKQFDVTLTGEFRNSWADGPLSASKKLERLRSIMTFAVERDWLTKNPATALKSPRVEQRPTLPFSAEEMKKIVGAAKSEQRVYTFILTMRSSGLRISDVTTLAVESLKGNRLSLYQAKTGEHVSILLDESVADALRAVVPLNKNKSYFFWTGESTVPAAVSNWRKRIADVFDTAGIKNGHTHRFRDTFAVALLEKGATIGNVSRLLGHTSIKITEKHYNPWVKSRQDALDADLKGANGWLTELQAETKDNVVSLNRRKKA
jgi:integrase/recombinase XerD